MRRVVLAAGLVALSSAALAGINPLNAGLPSFNVSDTRGYGTGALASPGFTAGNRGNQGSSMCVECHSVNPSRHIVAPAGIGVPAGPANPGHWGSHTVLNSLTNTAFTDYTNSGGGFPGGRSIRDAGEYMMKVAWPTIGGQSKYNTANVGITGPLVSTNGNAVGSWANADMICESCHNILTNGGDQYLVGAYADTADPDDTLCVVCHDGGGDATASYADFHTNGNMHNFNQTQVKRHHVLAGDTFVALNYNPDSNVNTNDSRMWAPSFSDKLLASWCTSPYSAGNPAPLPANAPIEFRNMCNVSGVGTRENTSLNAGADIRVTGDAIRCNACHRPHNARSRSGAFIFRMGGTNADFTGTPGTSGTTVDTIGFGIRRQNDTGNFATTKVYGEYVTLCNGCHQGYGQ